MQNRNRREAMIENNEDGRGRCGKGSPESVRISAMFAPFDRIVIFRTGHIPRHRHPRDDPRRLARHAYTSSQGCRRVGEDPREDVGVCVVECGLMQTPAY